MKKKIKKKASGNLQNTETLKSPKTFKARGNLLEPQETRIFTGNLQNPRKLL